MKKFLVIFALLILPSSAWAGQLFVEFLTMTDISRNGFAILGTITSVHASKQMLTLSIKKVWVAPERSEYLLGQGLISGSVQDFAIYQGVVWDNPAKSPIDTRVPGAVSLSEVTLGQDVILVWGLGYEILPAGAGTLKKLDLFFSKKALDRYRKISTPETLYADLKDVDLQEPALEAMSTRKLLHPRAFLALKPEALFQVGVLLGQRLSAREFDQWLAAMLAASKDATLRARLEDIASNFADKVSPATQLKLQRALD